MSERNLPRGCFTWPADGCRLSQMDEAHFSDKLNYDGLCGQLHPHARSGGRGAH